MGLVNKFLSNNDEEEVVTKEVSRDDFYNIKLEEAVGEDGKSRMILLEPRACSEAFQIIDHLKSRNAVVVNLKRVTSTQAKKITYALQGAVHAISGDIQQLGAGIFLLTPNNINIQGKITDEKDGKNDDKDELSIEW